MYTFETDLENPVVIAFKMFFNSFQIVYLHHNKISFPSQDFQHIAKNF